MELGGVEQSVTITAEPPVLNTSGADLGQVIDRRCVRTVAVALTRNEFTLDGIPNTVPQGGGNIVVPVHPPLSKTLDI